MAVLLLLCTLESIIQSRKMHLPRVAKLRELQSSEYNSLHNFRLCTTFDFYFDAPYARCMSDRRIAVYQPYKGDAQRN
jgi:hypothetical protein